MKIRTYCEQITLSKIDEIRPLTVTPTQSYTSVRRKTYPIETDVETLRSTHKKVKCKNMNVVPKPMSMHTPSKLSSGNENTDGRTYDSRTGGGTDTRADTRTANVIP